MQTIIVDVGPTGDVVVKTTGFSGKTCLNAASDVEKALGHVMKIVPTAEMNDMELQRNVASRKQ